MLSVLVLRMKKRLSQGDLAKLAGVTNKTICAIEKGNVEPKHSTVEKIASALGVTAEYLYKYEKDLREGPK